MAKTNGRTLSVEQKKEISAILDRLESECDEKLNFLHMFRGGQAEKTLILILCWVTVCIGFYALTFSQTKLAGDIFVNYLLFTLVDSPGIF